MPFTLEELEAKLKENPFAREFFDLAAAYQKMGRLEDAKKVCGKGLEKYPGHFQARLLLTRILIAEGKFKEAKLNVDRVLMVVPDNVAANFLAGDVNYSLGDMETALRFYKVVQLFEPGRTDVEEKIAAIEKAAAPEPAPPAIAEQESAPAEPPVAQSFEIEAAAAEAPAAPGEENLQENGTVPAEEPFSEISAFEPEPVADMPEEGQKFPVEETPSPGEDISPMEPPSADEEIGSDTLDSLLAEEVPAEVKEPDREPPPSPGSLIAGHITQPQNEDAPPFLEKREEKAAEEDSAGLNTLTIAELYEKQGYPEKAVEVYQHILLREPERKDIRLKIERLKDQMMGLAPEGGEVIGRDVKSALRKKRIDVLGSWLRKIKEEGNV